MLWLALSILLSVIPAGCRRDGKDDDSFPGRRIEPAPLTCVVTTPDSSALLLGTSGTFFTRLDTAGMRREDYALPSFTEGFNTYDILPLSENEWLVAKQNCGLLYLVYDNGPEGRRPVHLCRIAAPSTPLPDKGTHYSVYSMIDADSVIAIGSSNGLFYLPKRELPRMAADSCVTASAVAPLAHLRKFKYQFSQESMFRTADSLLTVTDNGIYRIAFKDFGNPSATYDIIDADSRCHIAALNGDTLAVLCSSADNPGHREVRRMLRYGAEELDTVEARPATVWLGTAGGRIREFGEEGTFPCFHAAVETGGRFYFIRNGELCIHDPRRLLSDGEQIRYRSGPYILSDRMGLFRVDKGNEARFLGQVKGVSGVRGMAHSGSRVYLVTADGVCRINAYRRLFPYTRRPDAVELNQHNGTDRAESVYASGDTLLIGTRSGLHALVPGEPRPRTYQLRELKRRYESPYIRAIARDSDGSYLLKTLNFGVWRLPSLSAREAVQTDRDFPDAELPETVLKRPALTWEVILDNSLLVVLSLFALIGLGATAWMIRRRHRSLIRQKDEEIERISRRRETKTIEVLEEVIPEFAGNRHLHCEERLAGWLETYRTASGPAEKEKAVNYIAHELHDFCNTGIGRILDLAAAAGNDSPAGDSAFSGPMKECAAAVRELGRPDGMGLPDRLRWLAAACVHIEAMLAAVGAELDADCAKCGRDCPEFSFGELAEIWNKWMAPWSVSGGNKIIDGLLTEPEGDLAAALTDNYESSKFKKTDSERLLEKTGRTLVLTSISFFGCYRPVIDGIVSEINRRNMLRVDQKKYLGTIYRFWAEQLSEGVVDKRGLPVPVNRADILWLVRLRSCTVTPDGRPTSRPTEAYSLDYGVSMACDQADGCQTRKRGRPKADPRS